MDEQAGTVIWRRRYDEARLRKRLQRFWLFFAAPAALIVVITAILSGIGPAAGLLILFGLFGALLFVWVWLSVRNERNRPAVTLDGGHLCWGKHRVPIDQILHFSTYQAAESVTIGPSRRSSVSMGTAGFFMVDGSKVRFVWVGLEQEQLDELRDALEQVLPGRWRSAETVYQAD